MLHNYLILNRKMRKKTFYKTPLFSYILTLPIFTFLTPAKPPQTSNPLVNPYHATSIDFSLTLWYNVI